MVGANGSDVNAYVSSCSSPVDVSAHNKNATILKEIPFFRKLDKTYERFAKNGQVGHLVARKRNVPVIPGPKTRH